MIFQVKESRKRERSESVTGESKKNQERVTVLNIQQPKKNAEIKMARSYMVIRL